MKNAERNAEIIRRRRRGDYPWQIGEALGISRLVVIGVCNRAGICKRDADAAKMARDTAKGHPNKGRSPLCAADVITIRARYRWHSNENGTQAIANDYGVSKVAIWNIVQRLSWKHVA